VVVGSSIRATNDHHGQAGSRGRGWMVNAVVVDGWLQQVGVVLQPAASVSMHDRCNCKALAGVETISVGSVASP
jgi:hypothetical protein